MIFSKTLYFKESILGSAKFLIDSATKATKVGIEASVKSAVSAPTQAAAISQPYVVSGMSGLAKGVFQLPLKVPLALWSATKTGAGITMVFMAVTAATAVGTYAGWDVPFLPNFDSILDSVKKVVPHVTWGEQPPSGGSVGVEELPKDTPTDGSPKGPEKPIVGIDGKPGSGSSGSSGSSGIISGVANFVGSTTGALASVMIATLGAIGAAGPAASSEEGGHVIVGIAVVGAIGVAGYAGYRGYVAIGNGISAIKSGITTIKSDIGNLLSSSEQTQTRLDKIDTMDATLHGLQSSVDELHGNMQIAGRALLNINEDISEGAKALDDVITDLRGTRTDLIDLNAATTETADNVANIANKVDNVANRIELMATDVANLGSKLTTLASTLSDTLSKAIEDSMQAFTEAAKAAATTAGVEAATTVINQSLPQTAAVAAATAAAAVAVLSPPRAPISRSDKATSITPPATPPREASSAGEQVGREIVVSPPRGAPVTRGFGFSFLPAIARDWVPESQVAAPILRGSLQLYNNPMAMRPASAPTPQTSPPAGLQARPSSSQDNPFAKLTQSNAVRVVSALRRGRGL